MLALLDYISIKSQPLFNVIIFCYNNYNDGFFSVSEILKFFIMHCYPFNGFYRLFCILYPYPAYVLFDHKERVQLEFLSNIVEFFVKLKKINFFDRFKNGICLNYITRSIYFCLLSSVIDYNIINYNNISEAMLLDNYFIDNYSSCN
jgi:hypothetical protein